VLYLEKCSSQIYTVLILAARSKVNTVLNQSFNLQKQTQLQKTALSSKEFSALIFHEKAWETEEQHSATRHSMKQHKDK